MQKFENALIIKVMKKKEKKSKPNRKQKIKLGWRTNLQSNFLKQSRKIEVRWRSKQYPRTRET